MRKSKLLSTTILLVIFAMGLALFLPVATAATANVSVQINEYSVPVNGSEPRAITAGPDGNLWFTDGSSNNKIGKVTTSGSFAVYSIPTSGSGSFGITTGPDGNIWFTEYTGQKIGKVTTAGSFTEYPLPNSGYPYGITAGSDGALWFTEYIGNRIGRITTSGSITEYPVPTSGGEPNGITAGSDGALWFTEDWGNKIGRITTSGSVTEYPVLTSSSRPHGITAGPDGSLWFTEYGVQGNKIGRITTSGSITEYPVPTAYCEPWGITAGPDGALWFAEDYGNKIGKITTSGSITEYPVITATSEPNGITAGPDGNLWFTESWGNRVGKAQLTATNIVVNTINPSSVTNTTSYTVEVLGSGFKSGATVSLVQGGTVINGTGVVFASASRLTCNVDLASKPVGKYDVIVKNTDGQIGQFMAAFSVTNDWHLPGVKWATNGVPVRNQPAGAAGGADYPMIISDGAGGAIMTWMETRYGGAHLVYAQRLDSSGNALWTKNGVEVRGPTYPSPSGWGTYPEIASDGAGGCIITWMDDRDNSINGVSKIDIYAQRVNASGNCLWTKDGVGIRSLATTQNYSYYPQIVSDGVGGAIITWFDFRSAGKDWMNPGPGAHYEIYAQKVNASGKCSWTPDGIGVRSVTDNTFRVARFPAITQDGSGGAIIIWQDFRRFGDVIGGDIYAQKVDANGNCIWKAGGVGVRSQTGSLQSADHHRIIPDGSGGAIISWQDPRSGKSEVYAQRVDVNGNCRWTTDGIVVRSQGLQGNGLSSIGGDPVITPDGIGGAVIAWNDTRSGIMNKYDIYAQRVDANGNFLWNKDGVGVRCMPDTPNQATDQQITPDGSGGAIITWQDERSAIPGVKGCTLIYAQRIDGSGHCRWPTDGVGICTTAGTVNEYPAITSDGFGEAIISWEDGRAGGYSDVFAQKIADGVLDAPTVVGITPKSGANNKTVNITNLAGTNFRNSAKAMLRRTGQTDIVASSVNVVSANKITCTFNINGATTGAWDVVVKNADGQEGKYAGGFQVAVLDPPTVTGITPQTGVNNASVSITNLAGTGFQTGAKAILRRAGQTDIVADPTTVASANQITCTFNINGAATGFWDVVVKNPDGQEGKYAGGFSVTAPPAPACGSSAAVSVAVLAGLFGILSLTGLGKKRKRR